MYRSHFLFPFRPLMVSKYCEILYTESFAQLSLAIRDWGLKSRDFLLEEYRFFVKGLDKYKEKKRLLVITCMTPLIVTWKTAICYCCTAHLGRSRIFNDYLLRRLDCSGLCCDRNCGEVCACCLLNNICLGLFSWPIEFEILKHSFSRSSCLKYYKYSERRWSCPVCGFEGEQTPHAGFANICFRSN